MNGARGGTGELRPTSNRGSERGEKGHREEKEKGNRETETEEQRNRGTET